eukprot:148225-Rhodomonas_salina.1
MATHNSNHRQSQPQPSSITSAITAIMTHVEQQGAGTWSKARRSGLLTRSISSSILCPFACQPSQPNRHPDPSLPNSHIRRGPDRHTRTGNPRPSSHNIATLEQSASPLSPAHRAVRDVTVLSFRHH